MILIGTAPDADWPRRLLSEDSSCRAARSKVFQDGVIRHKSFGEIRGVRSKSGGGPGQPDQPEQGETRVAIQFRGRIRVLTACGSANRGSSSGERRPTGMSQGMEVGQSCGTGVPGLTNLQFSALLRLRSSGARFEAPNAWR